MQQISSQVVVLSSQNVAVCFCSSPMLIDPLSENLDWVMLQMCKYYHMGQAYNYDDLRAQDGEELFRFFFSFMGQFRHLLKKE